VQGRLAAFAASDFDDHLGFRRLVTLWHSGQNPQDEPGLYAKFCCPTIAAGHVYHPTASGRVVVYGPKPANGGYKLGFGGSTGLALNGSAAVTATGGILLTDSAHREGCDPYTDDTPTFNAGSFFCLEPVDVRKFRTQFTFLLTNAAANGFTFTIQAEGPHALGSAGSGLGCRIDVDNKDDKTPAQFQSTITHCVALTFTFDAPDILPSMRPSSLALLINGVQSPDGNFNVRDTFGLDLRSGKPITATVIYDGDKLSVQLSEAGQKAPPQRDFQVGDISKLIQSVSGKAYCGFTGSTGVRSARQEILSWDFKPGTAT
jgi:hypothetical protein